MRILVPCSLLLAGFGLSATLLRSHSSGVLPAGPFVFQTPSCGRCHGPGTPGGSGLAVTILPSAYSLDLGQQLSLTVAASGGAVNPLLQGGFAALVTRGQLAAGANTRINFQGTEITHSNRSSRSWTFGYTAPQTQAGLVQVYAVCNTVDGDGQPSLGDRWGFAGADASATVGTPTRLFVNAPGVKALGSACVGSFGNVPVLGAAQSPAVGNQTFALEVHGAAPAAPVLLLLGANPNWQPFDMGLMGSPGCLLLVDPQLTVAGQTGGGNAARGEGALVQPLPIPNDPGLVGAQLQAQVAIVDLGNGRNTPLTMTNAVVLTLQ